MLRTLQVQNIALIERLELEIRPGFTALTGETGAGKSILLDAVGLLLGSRASSELVRSGADKAIVQGVFDIDPQHSDAISHLCVSEGIDFEEEQLVVSREVFSSGKTTARVNGRIVTVQFLRELGRMFIHQHGQHDSVALLRKEEHVTLLDAYGGAAVSRAKLDYSIAYTAYIEYTKKLNNMEKSQRERAQRLDLLQYQKQEIDAAGLQPGEEEGLQIEQRRLQHSEKLRTVVDDVYEKLYEGDTRTSAIVGEVYRLQRLVDNSLEFDRDLGELSEYLQTAQVNLSEAAEFVRHYKSRVEFDPNRLQQVEDRLASLVRLFRKYGESTVEILGFYRELERECGQLLNHEETLAELQRQVDQAQRLLLECGEKLSELRQRVADTLEQDLARELEFLLMPKVQLHLQFTATKPMPTGIDNVEILFSANQGEALKPLAKIASGGELSRVMLAITHVLSESSPVATLIFDEIDTGISGRAAQAVAERIAQIAKHHQVLIVTHMAQMACLATHHLTIVKQIEDGRTFTNVQVLTPEQRVDEIAKMIGGENVSETTRRQAGEMLNWRSFVTSQEVN